MNKKRYPFMALTMLFTMTAQTAWASYSTSGTLNSGQIQWVHNTDNKTLTFTGTGGITDLPADNDTKWDKTLVVHVVIGNGITSIGKRAFQNHTNLTDVTFEETANSRRLTNGLSIIVLA